MPGEMTTQDTLNGLAGEAVIILDYGSQYTQLITRRCRELSVFSEIIPGDATLVSQSTKRRVCLVESFLFRAIHTYSRRCVVFTLTGQD